MAGIKIFMLQACNTTLVEWELKHFAVWGCSVYGLVWVLEFRVQHRANPEDLSARF